MPMMTIRGTVMTMMTRQLWGRQCHRLGLSWLVYCEVAALARLGNKFLPLFPSLTVSLPQRSPSSLIIIITFHHHHHPHLSSSLSSPQLSTSVIITMQITGWLSYQRNALHQNPTNIITITIIVIVIITIIIIMTLMRVIGWLICQWSVHYTGPPNGCYWHLSFANF